MWCEILILSIILAKLLTEELQAPSAPRITKLSPKQTKASPTKPQRKENADFSDENDVNDASTDELEVEMVEQLDYKHDQQGKYCCWTSWILMNFLCCL